MDLIPLSFQVMAGNRLHLGPELVVLAQQALPWDLLTCRRKSNPQCKAVREHVIKMTLLISQTLLNDRSQLSRDQSLAS